MDTSKVYMVPDSSSSNNALTSAMALMNSNGGMNSWINNPWIYFVFLAMFGGNGLWGSKAADTTAENYNSRALATLQDTINNNHNNDLAFLAIQGNGKALTDLAGNLNVGVASLSSAISSIKGSIDMVGAQTGMGAERVVNSVILGNKDLAQLICSCCCENKQLVTTMGYEGQLRDQTNTAAITSRIDLLSNGVLTGFASTAYETQSLTNQLSKDLQAQTLTIIDKISALESNAQQDKINDLTAQLTAANARAERQAELQPIINELNTIKNAQPATTTVTYPNLVAVPLFAYNYMSSSYNSGSSFWN